MSVEKVRRSSGVVWQVRWREGDTNRGSVFSTREDARAFEAEVTRRKRMGPLSQLDAGKEPLRQYVAEVWGPTYLPHLARRTRLLYASTYDRHIGPRLGSVPLREVTTERIAAFQADLTRSGVGTEARHKAMTLLGAILQRAAEGQRIPYNPARLVKKARRPRPKEVRPLAPVAVERLRSVLDHREAMIISLLAYSGIRPGELRGLSWQDVRGMALLVNADKTNTRRTVRLLPPLSADLAEWREAQGNADPVSPVIPAEDGAPWSANGFEKWRQRAFKRALRNAGLPDARPYDLRHSFASLLLHEVAP